MLFPTFTIDTAASSRATARQARVHLILNLAIAIAALLPMPAAGAAASTGEQWAVLIGVGEHDRKSLNLQYTTRDVERMAQVLAERAGIDAQHMLQICDRDDAAGRPTKANIERLLPEFLAKIGPNDRLIVFFSGHGLLLDGEAYFVPRDFNQRNAKATSLPGRWFRGQLAQCRAITKFFILDACHAGGTRGDEFVGMNTSSEAIAKAVDVDDVTGCIVLASCRPDELSYEWPARHNGLFTYWLCRALEGVGDDGDGRLTSEEVYRYTHRRVVDGSQQIFGRLQTPVRIIGPDVEGSPELLTLRPVPPETLCRQLAEQLDVEIRSHDLPSVAVPEFAMPGGVLGGQQERLALATLPAYCAAEVRAALEDLAQGDYEVFTEERIAESFKGIRIEQIGDPLAMQQASATDRPPACFVYGVLKRRGRRINVNCELITFRDQESIATATAVAPLSASLLADLGESFQCTAERPADEYAAEAVQYVLQQASRQHPLLAPEFPISFEIYSVDAQPDEQVTASTPRKLKQFYRLSTSDGEESGAGEVAIRARKDEVFEFRVKNVGDETIGMALFVDGLNVRGQRRERAETAALFILRPGVEYAPIDGWYLPNEEETGDANAVGVDRSRFYFTDVDDAVVTRQGYGDSLNLISAVFFRPATAAASLEGTRELRVGGARAEQQTMNLVEFVRGPVLASMQIRYVDERDLAK